MGLGVWPTIDKSHGSLRVELLAERGVRTALAALGLAARVSPGSPRLAFNRDACTHMRYPGASSSSKLGGRARTCAGAAAHLGRTLAGRCNWIGAHFRGRQLPRKLSWAAVHGPWPAACSRWTLSWLQLCEMHAHALSAAWICTAACTRNSDRHQHQHSMGSLVRIGKGVLLTKQTRLDSPQLSADKKRCIFGTSHRRISAQSVKSNPTVYPHQNNSSGRHNTSPSPSPCPSSRLSRT